MKRVLMLSATLLSLASLAQAQEIKPDALRQRLFTIAHDSMGGRDTGSKGNWLTAEYMAAEFKRLGLEPAGESGTYYQTIPFRHVFPDTAARLQAGSTTLSVGRDILPRGALNVTDWSADGVRALYAGMVNQQEGRPAPELAAGKIVVFAAPPKMDGRAARVALNSAAGPYLIGGARGVALIALDQIAGDLRAQYLQGGFTTAPPPTTGSPPMLFVSPHAAAALLGGDPARLTPGAVGPELRGTIRIRRDALDYAARNVIGVLRGSDPTMRNTYISVTAHNDHVGYTFQPFDHDSTYAYNRVIRPMGADSPDRTPTPEEWQRIKAIRDSLRALRPSRMDSIFNGADDDGTGTVALLEVARALAKGPRPKRSIIFVSHAAEERGLLGSQWFTDHPTVPRDSIVGEADMDMIGRGSIADLPSAGPAYLEVVGSRRLSKEYGDLLEQVNTLQPLPFKFNYEYDAPGHPLQYYCRADHYSYARYGIPAFAVSRGEHADYHQVTDEPQYIDYDALARVANLILDFTRTIANLDHRPLVDGPRGDPRAGCRQ